MSRFDPILQKLPDNQLAFVEKMQNDLENQVKHNKKSVEKEAEKLGITNKNLVKELTELAIVRIARSIALCEKCPETGQKPTVRQKFDKIVDLYNHQVNLSQRTSESMLLQQYSTPAPISYLAGAYCLQGIPEDYRVFEPSAGNGLLTIAFEPSKVYVNEIDDVRNTNLKTQGFKKVTRINGTVRFDTWVHDTTYMHIDFDAVITNPPFGTIDQEISYGIKPDSFPIKTLDHLMALRALDLMKDTGKAAIIIGGHTKWDELGRIQAGKNRFFLNYLYRYYKVYDVLQIDGHKLYSRQGTAFDVRLILIDGRKAVHEGAAPLKQSKDVIIGDFDTLYDRVLGNSGSATATNSAMATNSAIVTTTTTTITTARARALLLKLKMMQLT